MRSPPTLYRYVKGDDALSKHTSGILWFHTFKYFRKIEDESRRDEYEGIGSGPIEGGGYVNRVADEHPLSAVYILCFSERRDLKNYGEHRLILRCPQNLKSRIINCLPEHSFTWWTKVLYSDEDAYSQDFTFKDVEDRADFQKPKCFEADVEWRPIIRLPCNFKILNDPLILDVDKLDGILDLHCYDY